MKQNITIWSVWLLPKTYEYHWMLAGSYDFRARRRLCQNATSNCNTTIELHAKCIRLTFRKCTFSTFTNFHVNFHSISLLHFAIIIIFYLQTITTYSSVLDSFKCVCGYRAEWVLFQFRACDKVAVLCAPWIHSFGLPNLRFHACAASPFECE